MSILIKEMDMPKTCALCPFREIRYNQDITTMSIVQH